MSIIIPPTKMGRPPTKQDLLRANKAQIEKMMENYLQLEWIADFYGVDADTFCKFIKDEWNCTFSEFRNKKMLHTRAALYNAIMDEAVNKRHPTLLIYASKNVMSWSNDGQVESIGDDEIELEFVDPDDPKTGGESGEG